MNLDGIIREARFRGLSDDEIKNVLLKKRYSNLEINRALNSFNKSAQKNKSQKDYNYLEKIKLLFTDPLNFFNYVHDDTIINSFILFAILSLISSSLIIGLSYAMYRGFFSYISLFIGIFYFLILIIGSFISAGIIHVVLIILKGEGSFTDTFNIVAYSSIPISILGIVPIVGSLSYIFSIVLMVFGISILHKISKEKAVIAALSPLLLIFLLVIVIISYFYLV